MPEPLMLALLDRAQCWAASAGTTLRRRPEDRALLAAAAEVFDMIGATPEGCVLLGELGLNPEAGALPSHDWLAARYAEHRAWVDAGGNAAEGGV